MIKKYAILACFVSFSLIAMEPENMVVFVGKNRPLIPLSDVQKTFPKLANTLMKAGYISKQENHYIWIYGTNEAIFPQEQKDALWHFDCIKTNKSRQTFIPCETLWKTLHCIHQWLFEYQTIGHEIIDDLLVKESMYPPLPQKNNWKNSHNIISVWDKKGIDNNNYYAIAKRDGSLQWHNHSLSVSCECLDNLLIPSFAMRYCQHSHSSDQAFTKEHVQQFCNNKALEDVALHEQNNNLTVMFKDNTQARFKKNQNNVWKLDKNSISGTLK